jgi:hypothetical protein
MRQTSRAVALLLALESANAAVTGQLPVGLSGPDYITIFSPSGSATGSAPTNSQQLNNRMAGYTGKFRTYSPTSVPTAATGGTTNAGWTDATYSTAKANDSGTVLENA